MERSHTGDAQLLARVPSPDAVAALYERHVDAVYGFAVRRCRTPEDVADLVATVFLEMFASARGYDARRGSARAWLLGIAVRCLADQRRSGYRQTEIARRLEGSVEFLPDEYEMVAEEIDAARAAPVLRRALSRDLTDEEREVFLLVATEGLSVTGAARALGVASGTARMRLLRARRKLRAAMAPAAGQDEPLTEGGRT